MKKIIIFLFAVAALLLLPLSVDAQRRTKKTVRKTAVKTTQVKRPKSIRRSAPAGPKEVPKTVRVLYNFRYFPDFLEVDVRALGMESAFKDFGDRNPELVSEVKSENGVFTLKLKSKDEASLRKLDLAVQSLLAKDSNKGGFRDFPEINVMRCADKDGYLTCETINFIFSRREKKP